jgi:hypothetical protein
LLFITSKIPRIDRAEQGVLQAALVLRREMPVAASVRATSQRHRWPPLHLLAIYVELAIARLDLRRFRWSAPRR